MGDASGMFGADSAELNVKIVQRRDLTPDVVEFRLAAVDGSPLPGYSAGAHIAVQTPSGAVRQYSLIGDGDETSEYRIAIKLEADSRGGSSSMIGEAQVGMELVVSEPKNDFEMDDNHCYLFIAAGIGITPIYTMARRAMAEGADFRLIYLARNPESAPYFEELTDEFGDRLQAHFTMGDSSNRYDFWDDFADAGQEHVYCCGPKELIEEIQDVSGHWPEGAVRFEDFKPVDVIRPDDTAFDVVLTKTGKTITVPADRSILEAMRDAGMATVSSCESGTCGTCKTKLLAGTADHRDLVLRDDERKDCIMICVSRSADGSLELDL